MIQDSEVDAICNEIRYIFQSRLEEKDKETIKNVIRAFYVKAGKEDQISKVVIQGPWKIERSLPSDHL